MAVGFYTQRDKFPDAHRHERGAGICNVVYPFLHTLPLTEHVSGEPGL